MILKEVLQELKNQQFTPEDIKMTHEIISAIRIFIHNNNHFHTAELFGEVERILNDLIEGN